MANKIYIADKFTLDSVKNDTSEILEVLNSGGSPAFIDRFDIENGDYTLKNVLDVQGSGYFIIGAYRTDLNIEIDGHLVSKNITSSSRMYYNGVNFSSEIGSINVIPFGQSLKIDFARNDNIMPASVNITYWLS